MYFPDRPGSYTNVFVIEQRNWCYAPPELAPYLATLFDEEFSLHLSVLGRGGDDLAVGLAEDFEAMKLCQSEWSDRVVMDAIETCLPAGFTDLDGLESAIGAAGGRLNDAAFGGLPVFLESDRDENWRATWTNVLAGLASVNASRGTLGFGFKLRCGGLVPGTFPSVEQVAGAIWLARKAGVPMKFTAGLHHPVRHYNDGVGAKMHGFLNVFFAGAIAASGGEVPEEQIREIIACEDASAFTFGHEDARCGTHTATRVSISAVRDAGVISFGSCSFAEPREDLCELGLMG
jgi:hypothetical protein